MIEKLTPEQERKMPEYVKRFINIGLDTTPIDMTKMKPIIDKVYRCGKIDPPKQIVYCPSPYSAVIAINMLRHIYSLDEKKFLKEHTAPNWPAINIQTKLPGNTLSAITSIVNEALGLEANLGVKINPEFIAKTHATMSKEYISSTLEGHHNVGFVSFYQFMRNELGIVEHTEPMTGIFDLTEASGWTYMYKTIAFVCDRYCKLYRDARGRLHSDDCACVEYPDRYKIYAWHGTLVPEYVIMAPETITMEDILNERNQEVRRVKIVKFGIDRFINNGEVQKIGEHVEFGELYHTRTLKDEGGKPFAFLKVINSTPEPDGTYKPYALTVNPDIKDVVKAWQSTFRHVDNFLPVVET